MTGAPPPKSRRSKHAGKKTSGDQSSAKGGQGSAGKSWPTIYKPWTGTIHVWPGPRPPLAPLPRPRPSTQQQLLPQQQQQQALLAYQQALLTAPQLQEPTAPSTHSVAPFGQWSAPALGFYNRIAGLPSWDQQSLASTFSMMTLKQILVKGLNMGGRDVHPHHSPS